MVSMFQPTMVRRLCRRRGQKATAGEVRTQPFQVSLKKSTAKIVSPARTAFQSRTAGKLVS